MESDLRAEPRLPVHLTSFVGREHEIDEVRELLETSRLLTLTGAGGSGKTRLAIEVARRISGDRAGHVRWIELASLHAPELLPQQIASDLGIREPSEASATDALLEMLREDDLLLVLDNCEHLVEACASLVDVVLRGCPDVRVLATSRAPLGVAGERAWLVPPLSLPDPATATGDVVDCEAVELFLARARDTLPSFALTERTAPAIREICRRLDGIPLALELAASRVKVLAAEGILERLDGAFELLTSSSRTALPRHRTLRATLDWSYDLLTEAERLLLQRLSVFSGGFTLDAAEAACVGGGVGESEVLDVLSALVDRSLVVVVEREHIVRYKLLETVHQYARERWSEADDVERSEVRRRHAEHHLRLAEAAHPALEGYQGFDEWLPRLLVEKDNFRAALAWSLEEEPAIALRLVGKLPYFWVPQPAHWGEGARWTDTALERAPEDSPAAVRGQAAWAAGLLAVLRQDWPRARDRIEEALSLAREVGERRLTVLSLGLLPMILSLQGEHRRGLAHGEEALRLARELDEPWLVVVTLITGVTAAHRVAGDLEAAEPALREALEVAQREHFLWGIWESAMHLALLTLERGNVDEAVTLARTAGGAAAQRGADWHGARVLTVLGRVHVARGDASLAARLLGAVEGWLESTGTRLLPNEEAEQEGLRATLSTLLGQEGLRSAMAEGRGMDLSAALDVGRGAETPLPPITPPGSAVATTHAADATARPSLEVAALGPLRIALRGEPLDPSAWIHAKPRELLLYLLCHPSGRTREQIGVAFWPEASAAQVKNSFHVLLHKLRKALGIPDAIVLEGERYRIASELDVRFDVFEFESGIVEALRRESSGHEAVEELRRSLTLHRGSFLEGEVAGDWSIEIDDRVGRLYVDGLSRLADLQMESGDLTGAAETLERLVRKEDLREDAYRRLMTCLARSGRRDQALRHHRRLVVLLRDELDAEPEPETEELAARIRDAAAV